MATEEKGEHDMKQEAFTLLAQGKRHLLVKDYFEATTSLALACEYLARIFGESADECGDAYFTYGKALLELARTETGVLGDAIEEKDEKDDDDSDEENTEAAAGSSGDSVTAPEGAEDKASTPDDTVEKPAEADSTVEKSDSVESTTVKDSETTKTPDTESANKESATVSTAVESSEAADKPDTTATSTGEKVSSNGVGPLNDAGDSAPGSSKENGHAENGDEEDEGSDEDDVSNLHLAWEVLELAKNIFSRQSEDSAQQLRLAEVQLALGEVALESENYTDATADMQLCLALQKKHLADDDRRIAETLYQMGVAYSLANKFDEAISSFSDCGHILERRVAGLKRRIAAGETPQSDDPFYSFAGEVDQLEKLFPEIREKIFDMQDFKSETLRAMAANVGGGGDPGAGSSKDTGAGSSKDVGLGAATGSSDKPIANIGHLVRKKQKTEEEPDAKRQRIDENAHK